MHNRYQTNSQLQGQFQQGSNRTVLVNKLGITSKEEVDNVELSLLELLYEEVLASTKINQAITSEDICEWHRKWLGNVYQWAGSYRIVNMSKDNFHFASASQVPKLMSEFNDNYLAKLSNCYQFKDEDLVEAMAIVHVEFILIHPFREGNGRLGRFIATIMALQAGYPELDYTVLDQKKDEYFRAIQIGLNCDYEPMIQLFKQVLQDTLNTFDLKS